MDENNLEKETEEIKEGNELNQSMETEEMPEEIPEAKAEKVPGFFNFFLGNVVDLIAVLAISLLGLAIFGLIIKLLGFYVKELLPVYLLITLIFGVFYNTILQTKTRATFGTKILGLKLKK